MNKPTNLIFSLLVVCLLQSVSHAQVVSDSIALFRVETRDGNEYTGMIISQDTSLLILQTEKLGTLTFNNRDVVRMIRITQDKLKNGQYWFDNPQSSRYLWSPNGYGLKKGEGYYQNIWVLFNQVSVGVNDYFSIGAGLLPLFFFGGSSSPFWITPKFSIPVVKEKLNLGAGALVGTVIGEESSGFGILYGITTVGSRDKNMSLGLGYGYSQGNWADSPTITLSGLIRTGARGYFLTENYYIDIGGDDFILLFSAAFRWVIKKAGLDFGIVMPVESADSGTFLIPWIGITIPFGNLSKTEKVNTTH